MQADALSSEPPGKPNKCYQTLKAKAKRHVRGKQTNNNSGTLTHIFKQIADQAYIEMSKTISKSLQMVTEAMKLKYACSLEEKL